VIAGLGELSDREQDVLRVTALYQRAGDHQRCRTPYRPSSLRAGATSENIRAIRSARDEAQVVHHGARTGRTRGAMTEENDKDLDQLVGGAFAQPATSASPRRVERAEAAGIEHEGDCPSLRQYRPPSTRAKAHFARRGAPPEPPGSPTPLPSRSVQPLRCALSLARASRADSRRCTVGRAASAAADARPPETKMAIGPVLECASPCCAGAR
jgi:hypothetical protein